VSRRSSSSSRGRRRGGNRNNRNNRLSVADSVKLNCSHCGKEIRHPHIALTNPENGEPIHFDCALQSIGEKEKLGEREKICYLGQGSFGIIQYSNASNRSFVVKKRIPYERNENTVSWRKTMRYNLDGN